MVVRKVSDLGELSEAEKRVLADLDLGEVTVLGDGARPEAGDVARKVRASLIRLLMLGDDPEHRLHEAGLQIRGAWIPDALNLEGCRDLRDLGLFDCHFDVTPILRSAGLANLHLNRSHLPGLSADRLEARGGVFLRNVEATGAVRLLGAKLDGNLECDGATFRAETDAKGNPGDALSADGLEAKGYVFLRGVDATGAVRLLGAKLGVNLKCDGATFRAETDAAGNPGKALGLDGVSVAGVFFLRGGARVVGALDLTAAEIGGFNDEEECWPGGGDLLLDRCRYGAFTGGPVDAEARLRWLGLQDPARWGGDFWPQPYEQCAKVLREMGHGGEARKVLIEKERLQREAARNVVAASLSGARLRRRVEQEGEKAVRPEILESLGCFAASDPRWKLVLTELRRSPEVRAFLDKSEGAPPFVSDDTFDRASAARAPVWDYWWRLNLSRFWDGLVGATIGYGRAPQRAALWALGFFLFGWFVFAWAGGDGAIKPNSAVTLRSEEWVACAGEVGRARIACFEAKPRGESYPQFNALVYSADTLLPIVSLEMQDYWIPDEDTRRGAVARVYLWVHIAVGWALSLLAVAGFSGLVKSD